MLQDLTIEFYMRIKLALMRPGNEEDRRRLEYEAHYMHALALSDAVHGYSNKIMAVTQSLRAQEANYFLRYGALQRLMMIFHAFKRLVHLVPDDRRRPLNTDESRQLTIDLNAIYINLKGILDNYAWSILHETNPELARTIDQRRVHLFSNQILSQVAPEKRAQIFTHNEWDEQLRSRRNPSAHQIPLSVPPTVLTTEADGHEYSRLHAEAMVALGNGEFEITDRNFQRMETMGTFVPCFRHHPGNGTMPIYPTLTNDVFHLLSITEIVVDILRASAVSESTQDGD